MRVLAPLSRPETSSGHRHPMMHPQQPIPSIGTMPDNSEGSLDPSRPPLPTLSLPMVPVHDRDGNSDDSTHATVSASEQPSVDYTPANISTSTITPVIRVLDPTLPPYTPLPRPSTERLPKGKTKPKSAVATSKEDIALEFSKIEVNTIRARLKVLETKNKDLEFQNSLLLERVAVYERAEKEAIYEKYFPKPNSVPATDRSDHPPPPAPPVSQCPATQCCSQRYQCCQPIPRCHQTIPTPATTTTDTLDIIFKNISEVKCDLSDLKTKLNKFVSPVPLTSQAGAVHGQKKDATDASHSDMVTDGKAGTSCEQEPDHENDDSVITIDTPELPDEQSLNSALTIQLQKLRQ